MKTDEIFKILKELKLEFYKIQCQNWILNRSNGTGAAGRTLEILLNKESDRFILPDYRGIEIKTKLSRNESYIALFSMAFDNKPLEMRRLLNGYGYPDRDYPQYKVFFTKVFGNKQRKVGYSYSYQLKVDYLYKVVRLLIFNRYNRLIDWRMSWSFAQLQSRLEHKLQYLALVHVQSCNLDNKLYFKYLDMNFFKLKDFSTFLQLIEKGDIRVCFKLSFVKSGMHFGEYKDHGTSFEIKEEDILKLFDSIVINENFFN